MVEACSGEVFTRECSRRTIAEAFSRAFQFPHFFCSSMTSSISWTRFNTAPQPGGPPVEKEEAFERASDKKVTLARVGPSSGVMRLAQFVGAIFVKRLVIRRRCSNAVFYEAQEGCMRECFVYWSERVLQSWIATGTQRVVPTATAHSCTTFRSVVRQVTVDAQCRFLIRNESHLLPVWTFRRIVIPLFFFSIALANAHAWVAQFPMLACSKRSV